MELLRDFYAFGCNLDDEPAVCREIEELLAGQLVRADLDGNTRVFPDGESLVRAYERGEADFQIVFLDIKMQAMNGISARGNPAL